MVQGLLFQMKKLNDPRQKGKIRHDLSETLTWLTMAYMASRSTLRRAVNWANRHLDDLRRHMVLKEGIPSLSTLCRILSRIDEEEFVLVLASWTNELLRQNGIHVIIDGKALKAATQRLCNGDTPYILNAIDSASRLVIAQMSIAYKSNEISFIPKLLDLLDLSDNIITIDAIGTQTKIIEKIIAGKGHYLLSVKSNQPSLLEEIKGNIEMVLSAKERKDTGPYSKLGEEINNLVKTHETYETFERNRERREYRKVDVLRGISLSSREEMAYDSIRTCGLLEQMRIPIEKDCQGNDISVDPDTFRKKGSHYHPFIRKGEDFGDDIETIGLITDLDMKAEEMLKYKRCHWRIENSLHYVLDVSFGEDRCPAKKSKGNLSLIRKFAYNYLRISLIKEGIDKAFSERMDDFADDFSLYEKYVLNPIESLN